MKFSSRRIETLSEICRILSSGSVLLTVLVWHLGVKIVMKYVLGQSGNASNILFRHAESKTLVIQGVLATFYPNISWF